MWMIRILFLSVLTALIYSCGVSADTQSADGKLYMRTMSWAGGTLDISWYYVTKDKIVVDPVGGVNPLDMALETARNGRNIATYRPADDGTLEVSWGDGRNQRLRVEYKDGNISALDGGLMSLAKPFEKASFEDITYSGLASVAQVTQSVTLFFGKDGKFRMQRVGAVTGGAGTSGVGIDERSDEGIYEIKGNTIHYRFNNGTEQYAVGQPYDLGNGEIIIGDQLFKKSR
jgi:hypothetical protein